MVLQMIMCRVASFMRSNRKNVAVLAFWLTVIWIYHSWLSSSNTIPELEDDNDVSRYIDDTVGNVDLDKMFGWRQKVADDKVVYESAFHKTVTDAPVESLDSCTDGVLKDGDESPDLEELSCFNGTLEPHDTIVVPNMVHYIWYTCHEYKFYNFLSILSAYRILQADRILFHTDCEPIGRWWNETKLIPVLDVIIEEPKQTIFGRKINEWWPQHFADIGRIRALMEYGGIYLDVDVFVVNSMKRLRHYDFVMGRPKRALQLNNGILVAQKNSDFLRLYHDSYRNYNSSCYLCNSMQNVNQLAYENRDLLHIEYCTLGCSTKESLQAQITDIMDWKSTSYSLHYWKKSVVYSLTPESIKTLNTTLGEVARYLYYGNTAMLKIGSKPRIWYNLPLGE